MAWTMADKPNPAHDDLQEQLRKPEGLYQVHPEAGDKFLEWCRNSGIPVYEIADNYEDGIPWLSENK